MIFKENLMLKEMETKQLDNTVFMKYSFFKGKFKGMVCLSHEFLLKTVNVSSQRCGLAGGQEVVSIKLKTFDPQSPVFQFSSGGGKG